MWLYVLQCNCSVITVYCSALQCIIKSTSAPIIGNVLQRVAVCCSVLQYLVVCCSVIIYQILQHTDLWKCVASCCSMLQRVAVCCSVLQRVDISNLAAHQLLGMCCSLLQYVAACYSVLQRIAVCCCVLQYVYISNLAAHRLLGMCTCLCNQVPFDFRAACVLQCVAVCCSVLQVLQPVAVCCSVMQCTAVRCSNAHLLSQPSPLRLSCGVRAARNQRQTLLISARTRAARAQSVARPRRAQMSARWAAVPTARRWSARAILRIHAKHIKRDLCIRKRDLHKSPISRRTCEKREYSRNVSRACEYNMYNSTHAIL